MRFTLPILLLTACGGEVLLDGRAISTLDRALERAESGSVIDLLDSDHTATMRAPPGITLQGPGRLTSLEGPLLQADGDLELLDIVLEGGRSQDPTVGSALTAFGDLRLEDVVLRGGEAPVAMWVEGNVWADGGDWSHDGTTLTMDGAFGRAPSAVLRNVVSTGVLRTPADDVVLQGVSGTALLANGRRISVSDSSFQRLELRSPSIVVTTAVVEGGVQLNGGSASVQGITTPVLRATVRSFDGTDLHADELSVWADQITVQQAESTDLRLSSEGRVGLYDATADQIDVVGVEGILSERLTAGQLRLVSERGAHEDLVVRGPTPHLLLQGAQAHRVIVKSDEGPARITVDGASLRNLVVVEPPDVQDDQIVYTESFATVEYFSVRGGVRQTSLQDGPERVAFIRGLLDHAGFGEHPPNAVAIDVVQLDRDGLEPDPHRGVFPGDPGFLGPGDVRLAPDSPHIDKGAFAGVDGDATLALWETVLNAGP